MTKTAVLFVKNRRLTLYFAIYPSALRILIVMRSRRSCFAVSVVLGLNGNKNGSI